MTSNEELNILIPTNETQLEEYILYLVVLRICSGFFDHTDINELCYLKSFVSESLGIVRDHLHPLCSKMGELLSFFMIDIDKQQLKADFKTWFKEYVDSMTVKGIKTVIELSNPVTGENGILVVKTLVGGDNNDE